ncbi:MAG: DUF5686 family protein [Imperialibacter sp.]|uniref:DUF5686 and carboxypeptidase-like regulatory domain-containing protein n=1 Tax=Imperialibacter sp. TaxID=2038411 RepID=UPI0032EE149A
MKRVQILFLLVSLSISNWVQAQGTTVVWGKVTEASTGSPIPFANVIFKGTSIGATTDFEGYYKLSTTQSFDSIHFSYIGFVPKTKFIVAGKEQNINIQLEEDVVNLQELVFEAGENPAFQILRNIVDHKKANDKRKLLAYEYEAYTKIEMDIDNISDKFKQRKIIQKVTSVLDSIEQIAGDDGKPVLPVFISEAISKYYYKDSPRMAHETVLNTKVTGVGVTDGTLASQVIGASFQQYNFYQNWLNIVGKDFVSPISDGWKINYEYDLVDSLWLGDYYCYRLDFFPKREQDLAFRGSMWIHKDTWAIRQIDVTLGKEANVNFIEKIKIQQELVPTTEGAWLPAKTRVMIDVSELTTRSAGFLAKFYVSNKDIVVNQPKPDKFYENPIEMVEDVNDRAGDNEFWADIRHDTLSATEVHVYEMIDTLTKIPVIKTYTDIIQTGYTGYYKIGKFDIGPYSYFFGNNNIEGTRLGLGGRTNIGFSRKWELSANVAYGFKDEEWKYKFHVRRILSRSPWTEVKYMHQKEIDQIWLLNDDIDNANVFYTFSRFGTLIDPFLRQKNYFTFFTVLGRGLSQRVSYRQEYFKPLFDFAYYKDPYAETPTVRNNLSVAEVIFDTHYAPDEIFVINDNQRVSMGTIRWPAVNFRYTLGLSALGGDFTYHKLGLSIEKRQKMGIFGVGYLTLSGGYNFNNLPYPLLKAHIGNQTPFYFNFAYNMMDYFEFVTDKHVAFRWNHSFNGFLLNSIPAIKKLKWRLVGTVNVLYGGVGKKNYSLIPPSYDANGDEIAPFFALGQWPYIEAGYGVENIFRFFRVDFIHRLTYTNRPGVNNFGIKFSYKFSL